jgi:sugar/nucleoside kinase (ribokinase family)
VEGQVKGDRPVRYDVFGIGNAIVDLQLKVDDAFLDHIGVSKGLMTLVESERQVELLATLADRAVKRSSGGSACNTVVGVADMGGTGAYACKTGDDDLGRFYATELRRLGIAVPVAPSAGITGTSVILITPDAQRTMLTHLGISSTLGKDDLPANEIARAEYLYVEGYLFPGERTRAAALAAIEIAAAKGVKVALTLSDAWVVATCKDLLLELIRGPVDLLFANREEARALVGSDDPLECARAIHREATNVALTLGADGSLLVHGNEVFPIEGVGADAVDTTGAGDMYAAGVLYGLTHGLTWRQAGRLGSHAAAQIVSQMGARLPRPFTADEIRSMAG